MADNVEIHNKTGITVKTGGSKEFHYNDEDLERIRSDDTTTKGFKEALALDYYIKYPQDSSTMNDLKKYKKFFKIKYKIFNKKEEPIKKLNININIQYKKIKSYIYRPLLSFDCSESFEEELPISKYRIIISKRYFFFLKKKTIEEIDLTKNISKEIIL